MNWEIVTKLQAGETVSINPRGNSMTPRISSGETVVLTPIKDQDIKVGNIVLSRVSGKFWLHLISAVDGDRVQISNNKGRVNGWTHRSKVYGLADK
jgi:hypothetical protein